MEFKFRKTHNPEERKKESENVLKKFPGKIPCIMEKDPSSKFENYDEEKVKKKYLLAPDITADQLIAMLKSNLKLDPTSALFVTIEGKIALAGMSLMGDIYETHKNEDGFLYICYSSQQCWGCFN